MKTTIPRAQQPAPRDHSWLAGRYEEAVIQAEVRRWAKALRAPRERPESITRLPLGCYGYPNDEASTGERVTA